MEDTLQRVFSILISVMIFFLLPLYMAFEKKDDISYSLALKISSNFVDEVCSKGYMTLDMYNNFISNLALTDNTYDISMEHVSKVYEPVIYAYDKTTNTQYSFDYQLYRKSYDSDSDTITINDKTYINPTVSYKVNDVRYYDNQMVEIMEQDVIKSSSVLNKIEYTYDSENKKYSYTSGSLSSYIAVDKNNISPISGLYRTSSGKSIYPMNTGDNFTIVVKNTNTTIASMLFNTLTFGAKTGADTKVYINYGGTIKNEEYRQTVIDSGVTDTATENTITENSTTENSTTKKTVDEIISSMTSGYTEEFDVNGDGVIDFNDSKIIKKYCSGWTVDIDLEKCDFNDDGEVGPKDSAILTRAIVKIYDFNKDDELDDKDADFMQTYLILSDDEKGKIDKDIVTRMDINADGVVDTKDVVVLKKIIKTHENTDTDTSTDTTTTKTYIYNEGNSYTISGGIDTNAGYYSVLADKSHPSQVTNSVTDKCIKITNTYNGYRTYIATNSKVDFSGYKKLYVDLEVIPGSDIGSYGPNSTWVTLSSLKNFSNLEVNDKTKQTIAASSSMYGGGRKTLELDVSSISTSYYVTVSMAHQGTLNIYSIWLE